MSDERKISERYSELSREEPPRHVDEAILAAARRAAETRPVPLVVPSGRQRWYFPLAAAAIIVLAVAVTMHVEREQPDAEIAVAPAEQAASSESKPFLHSEAPAKPAPRAEPKPEAAPNAEPPSVSAPDPKPAPSQARKAEAPAESRDLGARRENAPLADLQKATPPAAAPATPQRDAELDRASASARADEQVARQRQAAPTAGALSSAVASYQTLPPEQVLQGIADLRRQGRHEEADKALAEFRKRYPDYQISEEIRAKVERR